MTYIDRDIKTIGKHVNNAIEKELEGIPTVTKFATVQNEGERLVLFESEDKSVSLSVPFENETVWLNQSQMTQLFSVNRTVITKHVNNVFKEQEVDEKSNVHFLHIAFFIQLTLVKDVIDVSWYTGTIYFKYLSYFIFV